MKLNIKNIFCITLKNTKVNLRDIGFPWNEFHNWLNLLNCAVWLAELSILAVSNGWTAIKNLFISSVIVK